LTTLLNAKHTLEALDQFEDDSCETRQPDIVCLVIHWDCDVSSAVKPEETKDIKEETNCRGDESEISQAQEGFAPAFNLSLMVHDSNSAGVGQLESRSCWRPDWRLGWSGRRSLRDSSL